MNIKKRPEMSKSSTLFDPGKILKLLEDGLTAISIKLENAVEGKLGHLYKKDKRRIAIKQEKKRRKENIELAKSQDISLELAQKDKLSIPIEKHQQIVDRIQELDEVGSEESQETDIDRD
jgi:hypothetical protein